jgi:4-amino-4-deoxy-L-arabinose transferase-like glycosyltransferase
MNPPVKENRASDILLLLAVAAAMAWLSDDRWGDLIIDTGRQLYLTWQLSLGKVMHKDLFYFQGPLPSHLHALLFRIFGPGIRVLATFNLMVIAGLTALIYLLIRKLANRITALMAGLVFVMIFAFGHYLPIGIFNYVLPYSFEITHGLVLALWTLYQLTRLVQDKNPKRLAWIGFGIGLVFVSKLEIFVALSTSVVLGLLLLYHSGQLRWKTNRYDLFTGIGLACLPALVFVFYFSIHMSWSEALQAVFFPFLYVADSSPASVKFYHAITGINSPLSNAGKMFGYGAIVLTPILFFLGLNHLSGKFSSLKHPLFVLTLFLSVLSATFISEKISWLDLARPLPLFAFGYLIWLCMETARQPHENRADPQTLPILVFAAFSFLMLMKVILNTSVATYGFVLALPATLIFIKWMFHDLPHWSEKTAGSSQLVIVAFLGLLFLTVQAHTRIAFKYYRAKNFPVSAVPDPFLYYSSNHWDEGMIVKLALDLINKNLKPDEGFTALPEGAMLNYLSRRENPIRFINYDPFDWQTLGEKIVIDALKEKKPAYILLVARRYPDYGYSIFGKDYGTAVYSWITKNYTTVALLGYPPQSGTRFGIQILKLSK